MEEKVFLPKLGESIVRATIVKVLKNVGDHVELDEPLFEVSTDKVNSEIPSPVKGVVKSILVQVDDDVEVGAEMAIIESENVDINSQVDDVKKNENSSKKVFFSPVVINFAKEKNVHLDELANIKGTGIGGRISKKDVENYILSKNDDNKTFDNRIKLSPIRKKIAENMINAIREIPHATLISEVNITDLLKQIQTEKKNFFEKYQAKLSITSYIVLAISEALKKYPLMNVRYENNDNIFKNEDLNIGIAVDVKDGVIVPVIKKCQNRDIVSIAKEIFLLASKARDNNLDIKDIENGTITVTNYGMTGIKIGFPIINAPQVAIIGIGAIRNEVIAKDGNIEIADMISISLTFDHRIVDGIYGCNFLNEIKQQLLNF